MDERVYCRELASAAAAPLQGTAIHVELWLLIEYARPWRARALQDNEFPAEINAALARLVDELAGHGVSLRVQFIKQASSAQIEKPRLFLADGRSGCGRLMAGTLESYASLTELRAADLLSMRIPGGVEDDAGVYLVCTNGQRDLCCARFGLPVYESLRIAHGTGVWQTSHVGGHRYAPNIVCLPSGIVYGFAEESIATELVANHQSGVIALEHLRGRSGYTPAMQAADCFVRAAHDHRELDPLRFKVASSKDAGDSSERQEFSYDGAYSGRVTVHRRVLDEPVVASCGAVPKQDHIYELMSIS